MAIPFIYSFSGNSAASAPISTFMCLWAIYLFPGSVHIFPPAEKEDPSWEYIIRSQTHECGNWDWGPNIPFLGKFVSSFRHFVFAVRQLTKSQDFRRNYLCDIHLRNLKRVEKGGRRYGLCVFLYVFPLSMEPVCGDGLGDSSHVAGRGSSSIQLRPPPHPTRAKRIIFCYEKYSTVVSRDFPVHDFSSKSFHELV